MLIVNKIAQGRDLARSVKIRAKNLQAASILHIIDTFVIKYQGHFDPVLARS